MYRSFIILLLILMSLDGIAQGNVLRGLVKLQSSGSQPLSGVQVSAFGSNSTFSTGNGLFELRFASKNPGDVVSLIIQMDGYEVVNERDLQSCVLRDDPDDLVYIVMAKQGERGRQAILYYNIIVENTDREFRKELQSIQRKLNELEEDHQEREALKAQIAGLIEEKDQLLKKAESLAKQLASVDLDRSSKLAQKAYDLFEQGDIQAAISTLSEEALSNALLEAKEEKVKLEKQLVRINEALNQGVENYMIKARFCISNGQIEEAIKNFQIAIEADSSHAGNIRELAIFYSDINRQEEAILFYLKHLKLPLSEIELAKTLSNLGFQYAHQNDYENAARYYQLSLDKIRLLENGKDIDPMIVQARNFRRLSTMHIRLNDYDMAKDFALKALDIYRSLKESGETNQLGEMGSTFINLGVMYKDLRDFENGLKSYSEGIQLLEELAKDDPSLYEAELGQAIMNLGILYRNFNILDSAESTLIRSRDLFERLADERPERFGPSLGAVLVNLANVYLDLKLYDKSMPELIKAREIYADLVQFNPKRYEWGFSIIQNNLGNLLTDLRDYEEAETAYLEALKIREGLARVNTSRFEPFVARTKANLSTLYLNKGQFVKAEEMLRSTIETYDRLYLKYPDRYRLDYAQSLANLAAVIKESVQEEYDVAYRDEGQLHLETAVYLLEQMDKAHPKYDKLNSTIQDLKEYFANVRE